MKHFIKNFFNTLRRIFMNWPIAVFILAILILSLLWLHFTINSYQHYAAEIKPYQEVDELSAFHSEKLMAIFDGERVENFNFNFSFCGINTFVVPPPLTVFELNPSYGTITRGNIKAGGPIEIDNVIINIFRLMANNFFNTFTGTVFFLGGILFLILGCMIFNINAITAACDGEKPKLNFFEKFVAALISIIVLDGIFMAAGLLFSHYKGLTFPVDSSILHIYLLFIMIHGLTFAIGALCATLWPYLEKMSWPGGAVFVCIVVLVTGLAIHIASICSNKQSKMIDVIYNGQLKQMEIFNEMYRKLLDLGEKFGRGDVKSKQVQDVVLNYLNNEYNQVEALETQMIEAQIDYYIVAHRYEKFSPYSFFRLMIYEIAGFGGNNSINFNIYLRDKNRRYLKSILDNVYFSDEKAGKTYFKDTEPLFYSRSYIPRTIYQGVGIILCYMVVLLTICYFRLRILVPREIDRIEKQKEREKEIEQEWQQYMAMYKIEKEKIGKQEIIVVNGDASVPENA